MKFDDILDAARKMSTEDVNANLRALLQDPRAAAIVALIERRRGAFARSVCKPKTVENHARMAYTAGGMDEATNLLDTLKEIVEPSPRSRGPQPPEEE